MSATQNPQAPSKPPSAAAPAAGPTQRGGKTQSTVKKPEEKTDHFRRAVTVGVVFIGVIGCMVMVSGLLKHPKVRQDDQAGRAPIADQTPGGGLQSYDQSLAAYKSAHREQPAPTGQAQSANTDSGPPPADPGDLAYVRAAWRKPMLIKDRPADDHPNQPASQPRQGLAVPLPPPGPGLAPQADAVGAQTLQSPAQLAARYQAVEERLQRLRALQQQAAQGRTLTQATGAQQ